jgi:dihydrolipoamide dehydrogenase
VLGGGSPGEHCAGVLAEGGLRVALVERELGWGECSHWACIPSKTLLRPGEATSGAREAAATAEVDVEAVLALRDSWFRTTRTRGRSAGWRMTGSICARQRPARGRGRGRRRTAERVELAQVETAAL